MYSSADFFWGDVSSFSTISEESPPQDSPLSEPIDFVDTPLPNVQLLPQYGFAIPYNEFEGFQLSINLNSKDPDFEVKDGVIKLNNLQRTALIKLDGQFNESFIQALRCVHLRREDLWLLSKRGYEFLPENGFISLNNELAVYLELFNNILVLAMKYRTGFKTDVELYQQLVNSSVNANQISIVAHRLNTKRALHIALLRVCHRLAHICNLFDEMNQNLVKKNMLTISDHQDKKQIDQKYQEWLQSINQWKKAINDYIETWTNWVTEVVGPDNLGLIDKWKIQDNADNSRAFHQQIAESQPPPTRSTSQDYDDSYPIALPQD